MYLILKAIVKINKEIVHSLYKWFDRNNSNLLKWDLVTYYVVAFPAKTIQGVGLNNYFNYSAFDYMLETIFLGYYLLFMFNKYLYKIDGTRNKLLTISSENNNIPGIFNSKLIKCTKIQSAENCKDFSETIRQISKLDSEDNLSFFKWLAGVIDGDGNFDLRRLNSKLVLKSIRIKLHNRDIRILTHIQNKLHLGRIRADKNKPHSLWTISKKEEMKYLVNNLNGLIRLKVVDFKKSCDYLGVVYREANYIIEPFDPYLAGLVDTYGSIVYNYSGNRIECNLEFKKNEYSSKLNLDYVIPYYKPSVLLRLRKSHDSIAFKFQTVKGMVYLYDYFMKNRLYCDFKFYRVSKIKGFIVIRDYKNELKDSIEFKIYSDFILDWIQYRNPLWFKVPFIKKIR